MTYRELLEELQTEIEGDGDLDTEVKFIDVLDWLACMGVEGAAEAYNDKLAPS